MIGLEQIKLFGWDSAGQINPVGIFTWNTVTLAWERQAPISPAGVSSAVTIANGADVAEGATTDAAVVTDAAGTVSGKLRGLVKWAFERMPASLGQKAMAASLPIVIASDQSAIPLSAGTARVGAVYPVSGQVVDETGVVRTVNRAILAATASGNTQLVAAQGGGVRIRVLSINFVALAAVDVKLQSATTDLTGTYPNAANGGVVMPNNQHGWFQTAANEALNINLSLATTVGGVLTWIQAT